MTIVFTFRRMVQVSQNDYESRRFMYEFDDSYTLSKIWELIKTKHQGLKPVDVEVFLRENL